jgi:hypothetical protein
MLTKAWALVTLGQPREAAALQLGVIQMADEEDDLFTRLRVRYNLSGMMVLDDPHRGLRLSQEAIAICQQYGLALYAGQQAANAAGNALFTGDFDTVIRLEQSFAALKTPLAAFVLSPAAMVTALRGDETAAAERVEFVRQTAADSSSAQDISGVRFTEAMVEFGRGRLADARRLAIESREAYPGSDSALAADLAAHASVFLRDADGLRADLEALGSAEVYGARIERSLETHQAALLALEGRTSEAMQAYRRVIDEWRDADLPLDLGLALLQRAVLLGAADAQAAEGLADARTVFAGMGAEGLVDRLVAAAGPSPEFAAAKPAAQPTETVAR